MEAPLPSNGAPKKYKKKSDKRARLFKALRRHVSSELKLTGDAKDLLQSLWSDLLGRLARESTMVLRQSSHTRLRAHHVNSALAILPDELCGKTRESVGKAVYVFLEAQKEAKEAKEKAKQ